MNRYEECFNVKDSRGNDITLPRGFFRYRDYSDNIPHYAKQGESLWEISTQYYINIFPYPSLWYWVIADFQPQPIVDPTLTLDAGTVVYIPSARVLESLIDNPNREPEFERF